MKLKTKWKVYVDVGMTILLMFLMTYSLIGEAMHEWLGVGMFVLFVLHHILNRRWSGNILSGKYTALRVWQTILVFAVLLCIAGSMLSGIVLSHYVFGFLPISGGQSWARTLHLLCSYWGFVMMSLHLGFHWNIMIGMAGKAFPNKSASCIWILRILAVLIAGYGMYVFIKQDIAGYLFLKNHFVFLDFEKPLILTLLDEMSVMGLFLFVGHYITQGIRKIKLQKK